VLNQPQCHEAILRSGHTEPHTVNLSTTL